MSDQQLWPTRPLPELAARRYAAPVRPGSRWMAWLSQYGLLAGFMLVTAVLSGSSLARPFFIAGCAGLGYVAWRRGVGAHLELMIVLFVAAPLLRRVTDYHVGYDPSGIMLVGPLLALLVPCAELYRLFAAPRPRPTVALPILLYGVCIVYAWALSSLQGGLFASTATAIKFIAPLLYGLWLVMRGEPREALAGATRAFSVILPLIGVYGVLQWLNPQEWDRYWMLMGPMDSIGLPLPRQVRVFGPLNSPASYAMFITCGLLLVMNARRGVLTLLVSTPALIGLLLSQFRTAWIGLVIGLTFFMFLPATRRRSTLFVVFMLVAVVITVTATPFGEVVVNRLSTLQGAPTQDGSGSARLEQGQYLFAHLSDFLLGYGLAPQSGDYRIQQAFAADGAIIISIVDMGLIVGIISLLMLCWAGIAAIKRSRPVREPLIVAAGAIVAGQLIDIPLTGVTTGEIGFLTWTFIAVLLSLDREKTLHN